MKTYCYKPGFLECVFRAYLKRAPRKAVFNVNGIVTKPNELRQFRKYAKNNKGCNPYELIKEMKLNEQESQS